MDITARDHDIKQEVVAAYNEVMRKLKEKNFSDDDKRQDQIKQEEQVAHERTHIIGLVETPDDLVKNMTDLKQYIAKTLSEIKQRLLPEYEKFFTVRKAIALSEEELKELHNIKVSAGTLTALVQAQKEKILSYESELAEYRRVFAQERLQMTKEREKDETEYSIKRDAARKLDQEKYENSKREVEKALTEKRAAFEEEFESREARIAAREKDHQQLKEREAWILARDQEYHQLKEKAAYHSEELRLAIQKVESSAVEKLTSKYEYEAKLLHIEIEGERKMYRQKIAALEEQIEQYKLLKQSFSSYIPISEEPLFDTINHEVQADVTEDVREDVVEEVQHEIKSNTHEDILREFLLTD